jgi:hypothetical protein
MEAAKAENDREALMRRCGFVFCEGGVESSSSFDLSIFCYRPYTQALTELLYMDWHNTFYNIRKCTHTRSCDVCVVCFSLLWATKKEIMAEDPLDA